MSVETSSEFLSFDSVLQFCTAQSRREGRPYSNRRPIHSSKKKTASNHQAGGAKSDFCFWQGALKLFRTAHLGFLLLPVQILSSLPACIDKRTIRLFNPVNRTVVWLPLCNHMKDFLSSFAYARTAYGQSGARHLGILFLGLFVYFAGCSAFAASMGFTVRDCTGIIQDFTRIPERSVPEVVLRGAKGIAVIRVLKGAFGVSGRIGEGVVIARLPARGWSGPSAIATGGGGFGFQVGGQVTEFIIILNTEAAVRAFARGGNVEFGGALSVAAGPVGRAAEAGVLPVAAVYTYSRSQGFFAGASLEGTLLVAQSGKNAKYYRERVTPEEILSGRVIPPPGARELAAALSRF
jgi:SH3 domain-containing YSC84-like protein 1